MNTLDFQRMDLNQFINLPEAYRDAQWEQQFLQVFPSAFVTLEKPEVQRGRDGWPYLFVRLEPGAKEPSTRVMQWLVEQGAGLVVNAHKMVPDFVFSYGMVWFYMQTGRFQLNQTEMAESQPGRDGLHPKTSQAEYDQQTKWIYGPASAAYLPSRVRAILQQYARGVGAEQVRYLVVTSPDYKQTDLILSLESFGTPAAPKQKELAEAIAWFLPNHYNLVFASERDVPKMYPLTEPI